MGLETILESIKITLEEEGYVTTLQSPEIRKWEWEKGLKKITLIANHPMTEMRIILIDPSII